MRHLEKSRKLHQADTYIMKDESRLIYLIQNILTTSKIGRLYALAVCSSAIFTQSKNCCYITFTQEIENLCLFEYLALNILRLENMQVLYIKYEVYFST